MNYTFRKGYSGQVFFNCTVPTVGTLAVDSSIAGTAVYPNGTAVSIRWNVGGQIKGLYGIYNGDNDTVTYDPRVYTGEVISGGTMNGYNGADVLGITNYKLQSKISNATYSSAHIAYYSNIDYTIKTPVIRGYRGDVESLMFHTQLSTAADNSVVFIDSCNNYAYSVSPTISSMDTTNNKFKKSFEFKVARK